MPHQIHPVAEYSVILKKINPKTLNTLEITYQFYQETTYHLICAQFVDFRRVVERGYPDREFSIN